MANRYDVISGMRQQVLEEAVEVEIPLNICIDDISITMSRIGSAITPLYAQGLKPDTGLTFENINDGRIYTESELANISYWIDFVFAASEVYRSYQRP